MTRNIDDFIYNGEALPLCIQINLNRIGYSLLTDLLEHHHGKVGIDEKLHIPQISDYCYLALQKDAHVALML